MFLSNGKDLITYLGDEGYLVDIDSYDSNTGLVDRVQINGRRARGRIVIGEGTYSLSLRDIDGNEFNADFNSVESLLSTLDADLNLPFESKSVADLLLQQEACAGKKRKKKESSYATDQLADLDYLIRELEIKGYSVESSGSQVVVKLGGYSRGFSISFNDLLGEFSVAYIDLQTQNLYDRLQSSSIDQILAWVDKKVSD